MPLLPVSRVGLCFDAVLETGLSSGMQGLIVENSKELSDLEDLQKGPPHEETDPTWPVWLGSE
jgi:hypothetical protein